MLSKRTILAVLAGLGVVMASGAKAHGKPARLLLVHGRGQSKLDPEKLKQAWLQSLSQGASSIGARLPDELRVDFPFYGDELQRFVDQADLPSTDDLQARGGSGQDDAFLRFQADVAQSIRERAGVSDAQVLQEYGSNPKPRGPLNWEWVHAILKAIDRHGGGLSKSAIERITRDVYLYTTVPAVRSAIDNIVRGTLTSEPTVVVAHSLGSVVAYNVLGGESRNVSVPLLVTVGSPLGIRAIREQLEPISYPRSLKDWYNAFDTRDVVALFPLDERSFPVSPSIRNFSGVRNHTEDRHGIAGYLDDRSVASSILTAIGRG